MDRLRQALDAAAACAVIAAFAVWEIHLRRRPEAKIDWWWSREEPKSGYQSWGPGDPLEVTPGETLWVRVAVTNVGEASSRVTVLNMLAPAVVEIAKWDTASGEYEDPRQGAENEQIGMPPERSVKYFFLERHWPVGLTWVQIYRVTVPEDWQAGMRFRLGVDVGDQGFGTRGGRGGSSSVEAGAGGRFDVRETVVGSDGRAGLGEVASAP